MSVARGYCSRQPENLFLPCETNRLWLVSRYWVAGHGHVHRLHDPGIGGACEANWCCNVSFVLWCENYQSILLLYVHCHTFLVHHISGARDYCPPGVCTTHEWGSVTQPVWCSHTTERGTPKRNGTCRVWETIACGPQCERNVVFYSMPCSLWPVLAHDLSECTIASEPTALPAKYCHLHVAVYGLVLHIHPHRDTVCSIVG